MGLKFLHLSDIHFKAESTFDLDNDLRNEIEFDLEAVMKKTGPLDVVMVGGDIAFSASVEEYEAAYSWLKKICGIIHCNEENVLTVPGNHDVERSKICPILKGTQLVIKSLKERSKIDATLGDYLQAKDSCDTLLKTFTNYENFAQRYGAIPERNSPFFWEKDFECDGRKIRIRGVNSAIVSSTLDNEADSKLVLGSHQSLLKKEKGIIYVFLCHHPPEWLYDGKEAEEQLLSRARVHLYGHKHTFNAEKVRESLRLAAGAMHPSRKEKDWDPRYNVLELDIDLVVTPQVLKVKVWKRKWDKTTTKFVADFADGKEYEEYALKLDEHEIVLTVKDESAETQAKNKDTSGEKVTQDVPSEEIEVIKVKMANPQRKLNYLFSSLPYQKKLRIAFELNLIEDSDATLESEVQRTQIYLKRAQEKGLLAALWSVLTKDNPNENKALNPF